MASSSQPTAPPSSPSYKRQKLSLQEVVVENGVDRISNLPDCLLCHILSFLPTIEAVATSILSSRWKTLWTFVPCLYLDDNLNVSLSSSLHWQWDLTITVPHIMCRVFAQHKAPYLRKFLLDANWSRWSCDAFHVDTWVRASISPNLEELDLHLYNSSGQMFELPHSISNCINLVVLKLRGQIFLDLPSSFKLPSLKSLHLCLPPYNDAADWRLLSGCPVLEDLVLERDEERWDYDAVGKLEICVPTLKRLKFAFRIHEPDHPDYVLEINAPTLEYFKFIGDIREVFFLEKLPNLVEASVDINAFDVYGERDNYGDTVHYADKVLGLLREFYNVKFLSLSCGTTECLSFAYDYDLPMFHNLARLNYEFSCCNWHVLWYLLEHAPNLEVLAVDKSYCPSYAHLPVCLKRPLNVPRDLSPHLSTFCFRGFKGLKYELKFVRCILKKARVLKKMTFTYGGNYQNAVEEKSRILKKVSNFPRCSMSCQIAFE